MSFSSRLNVMSHFVICSFFQFFPLYTVIFQSPPPRKKSRPNMSKFIPMCIQTSIIFQVHKKHLYFHVSGFFRSCFHLDLVPYPESKRPKRFRFQTKVPLRRCLHQGRWWRASRWCGLWSTRRRHPGTVREPSPSKSLIASLILTPWDAFTGAGLYCFHLNMLIRNYDPPQLWSTCPPPLCKHRGGA